MSDTDGVEGDTDDVEGHDLPLRVITPAPEAEFYWTSGADGRLRLARCDACGRFHHPPLPICPYCHSRDVAPAVVSGRGTVATFTINRQPFIPGFDPPYVFAFVEVDEDTTIRLPTNIVGCPMEDVAIGMRVAVRFEHNGDWYVPLFAPLDDRDDQGDGR